MRIKPKTACASILWRSNSMQEYNDPMRRTIKHIHVFLVESVVLSLPILYFSSLVICIVIAVLG